MTMAKTLSLAIVATSVSLAAIGLASPASADMKPALAALGPPPVPADNLQTPEKIELGKLLFFDSRIGGDASVSCADCHMSKQGWGFNDPISRGYPGVIHWRNSQTVINSAYLGKLFWTGSAKSLENQAPAAALGAVSGNGERDMVEARLAFTRSFRISPPWVTVAGPITSFSKSSTTFPSSSSISRSSVTTFLEYIWLA